MFWLSEIPPSPTPSLIAYRSTELSCHCMFYRFNILSQQLNSFNFIVAQKVNSTHRAKWISFFSFVCMWKAAYFSSFQWVATVGCVLYQGFLFSNHKNVKKQNKTKFKKLISEDKTSKWIHGFSRKLVEAKSQKTC